MYRILYADPPWKTRDQLPGGGRGASKKYTVMSTEAIMAFPLPVMLSPSVLFLWRIASMQEDAFRVARAWGYTVKAEVPWVKTKLCKACDGVGHTDYEVVDGVCVLVPCEVCEGRGWLPNLGMGHYTRNSHETCLICAKGPGLSKFRLSGSIPSVIFAPIPKVEGTKKNEHSAKPEAMAELIESLYPGPYVELFGRRKRKGWTVRGLESNKRKRVR